MRLSTCKDSNHPPFLSFLSFSICSFGRLGDGLNCRGRGIPLNHLFYLSVMYFIKLLGPLGLNYVHMAPIKTTSVCGLRPYIHIALKWIQKDVRHTHTHTRFCPHHKPGCHRLIGHISQRVNTFTVWDNDLKQRNTTV